VVEQVAVFLDWQNVYRRARESFHDVYADSHCGQVVPLDLALCLTEQVADGAPARELSEVRIYRGMPDQAVDPQGYAAFRRQATRWALNRKVSLHARKLRYPEGWSRGWAGEAPREKGVDVALAVDLVTMAVERKFDTAIVMSSDQDLAPAVEFIKSRRTSLGVRVEVAAWRGDYGRSPNRITAPGVYCHWLDQSTYWGLMDETDYNLDTDPPSSTGPVPRPPRPRF